MLAKYQYILSVPDELDVEENSLLGMVQKLLMPSLETENENAEKFCMESLKMIPEKRGKTGKALRFTASSRTVSMWKLIFQALRKTVCS